MTLVPKHHQKMFSEKMEDNSTAVGQCIFRGVEYVVTMQVQNGNSLMIEVEDRVTADQWRATLDSTYVEDLTHKTGNFKQFNIFVNMLESALSQTSDCVSLDLMTYSDLESLRQRKSGAKSTVPAARSALNTKRYLILTYTVEFDRIHYPLPLPYVGKPDPRALQETIRELKAEIKHIKQQGSTDYKYKELEKLQKEYKVLHREKQELEASFLQYRRELKHTSEGQAVKEIRILKSVVKNLEEEVLKEKTRHQKSSSKRTKEYQDLLEEVEELRASERNLRVRVRSLTNELAMHKRQAFPSKRVPRPGSREHSVDRVSARERSLSYAKDRSLSRERPYSRDRSTSRGRPASAPHRSNNHSRTSDQRSFLSARSARSRSPSPAGPRLPRFDPTAYVKEKQRKVTEGDKKRNRRSRPGNSSERRRIGSSPLNHSRYSSHSHRNHSRSSSVGSQGYLSDGGNSDSSYSKLRVNERLRGSREVLKPSHSQNSSYTSTGSRKKERSLSRDRQKQHILSSTPERGPERRRPPSQNKENLESDEREYYDQSAEISEIDARLNRLQQLMKTSLQ